MPGRLGPGAWGPDAWGPGAWGPGAWPGETGAGPAPEGPAAAAARAARGSRGVRPANQSEDGGSHKVTTDAATAAETMPPVAVPASSSGRASTLRPTRACRERRSACQPRMADAAAQAPATMAVTRRISSAWSTPRPRPLPGAVERNSSTPLRVSRLVTPATTSKTDASTNSEPIRISHPDQVV